MSDIPEFHAKESFVIKFSRGPVTIHTGPCPYDWTDRKNFKPGMPVIMDGVIRKIKAYEYFATMQGPRLGTPVGLMFEDEK